MTEPPVWEYRIWPIGHCPIAKQLEEDLSFEPEPPRTDTYFLTPDRARHQAKLRGGDRLSVKSLHCARSGLEQWQTVLEEPFPIAGDTADHFARLFGLEVQALERPDDVRTLFAGRARQVDVAKKRRLAVRSDGLRIEIGLVTVGGHTSQTLNLEHTDMDTLARAVSALGFSAWPNMGYPDYLREIFSGAG